MTNGVSEFIIELSSSYFEFIGILLFCLSLYYILFRHYLYSPLDPLALLVLAWAMQSAVVLYAYLKFPIKFEVFLYFIISMCLLLTGFFISSKKIIEVRNFLGEKARDKNNLYNDSKLIFLVSLVAYLSARLYFLFSQGISIGDDEKFSYYRSAELSGGIFRILSVTLMINVMYCFLLVEASKGVSRIKYIIILSVIFVLEMSVAGKSTILHFLTLLFFVKFLYYSFFNRKVSTAKEKFYFIVAFLFAILVVYFDSDDLGDSVFKLIYRIVMFADMHMFVMVGDAFAFMPNSNWIEGLTVLFSDYLGFFRVYKWDELPPQLGNQIFKLATASETLKGPNPTHSFFGYYYFYWSGMIFSLVLGLLLGWSRGGLLEKILPQFSGIILYWSIFDLAASFPVDPNYAVQKSLNIILILIPLLLSLKRDNFKIDIRKGRVAKYDPSRPHDEKADA